MSLGRIRVTLLQCGSELNPLTELALKSPLLETTGSFRLAADCDEKRLTEACAASDLALLDCFHCEPKKLKLCAVVQKLRALRLIGVFSGPEAEKSCELKLSSSLCWEESMGPSIEDACGLLLYKIKSARLNAIAEKSAGLARNEEPSEKMQLPAERRAATDFELIALGASAGGTEALTTVLSALPREVPPIVLVQHMPAKFVPMFAERLRKKTAFSVCLAAGGEPIERGFVYLTDKERQLAVRNINGRLCVDCSCEEKVSGHRPSVDRLFASAAEAAGSAAIGVILTGMGRDGADGLLRMRQAGAYTIGQDRKSCVVYGMPAAASEAGAVELQLPLVSIADAITAVVSRKRGA